MLQLRNLTIAYAGQPSLIERLEVTVPAGELHLLQGPSGCGKSTLLAVIGGTMDDTVQWSGRISLNGVDISSLPAEQRGVGLMFQDALLFPHMSVGDNLAFGLAARHRRDRVARVQAALQAADLPGFADRDPASLSGGQAARAALMRTLLAEPQVLLMDEAFSALDPALRQGFGMFVRDRIRDRQIPALLVSHDPADANLADGAPISLTA
ncbi:MAG: ATP-binding cassette domain-containing protein [Alphaproteobacteria bacterium]|nr:ATP-binding cassette domain-containing protein [Alphaproteobacteria bacterium]